MYLDDGVSRSSAPKALLQYSPAVLIGDDFAEQDLDSPANDEYREVSINQVSTRTLSLPFIILNIDKPDMLNHR